MNLKEDINYTLWCDFIERGFLEKDFQELLNDEIIDGATSNPAIFAESIISSEAYAQQINMLQANENKKIYEELAITDIKRAAEILKPLYDKDANHGLISLEVDPMLCNDAEATIEEGIRLYKQIGFSNVMIKIPATRAGYKAMEALTALGINVNATLIFSPHQAISCAQALNEGINKSGKDTKGVISVFVSRFDRAVQSQFTHKKLELDKLGIIHATKCYHEIEKISNDNIRTLFASTGVKGDILDPSYYIDNLIFKNAINTAPLATIEHWKENGSKKESTLLSEGDCDKYFKKLARKGIDIDIISKQLLDEGLEAFKVSFKSLLKKVKL